MKIKHDEKHPRNKEIELIIETHDYGRMELQGGYPSDWIIFGENVIIASVDHRDAPSLEITPIKKFIKENEWIFEDSEERFKEQGERRVTYTGKVVEREAP